MSLKKNMPVLSNIRNADSTIGTSARDRSKLPEIPTNKDNFVLYFGGNDLCAMAMLQLRKSSDPEKIVVAVGSAVASIMNEAINMLGSKGEVKEFTGFDTVVSGVSEEDKGKPFVNNWDNAVQVTNDEIVSIAKLDESEVAAFFGILMRAISNVPEEGGSLDAFNTNRVSLATRAVIGKPKIFIPNSPCIAASITFDSVWPRSPSAVSSSRPLAGAVKARTPVPRRRRQTRSNSPPGKCARSTVPAR